MKEIRTGPNGVMLRPTRRDECVRRRAAEMVLPQVKGWLSGEERGNDEELITSLAKHIGAADGYEISKNLERDGWAVDAELVDILNGHQIYDAERELMAQWVRCMGLKLRIPIGSRVKWRKDGGTVVKVDDKLGQYGVRLDKQTRPDAYYVCDSEDVEEIKEKA